MKRQDQEVDLTGGGRSAPSLQSFLRRDSLGMRPAREHYRYFFFGFSRAQTHLDMPSQELKQQGTSWHLLWPRTSFELRQRSHFFPRRAEDPLGELHGLSLHSSIQTRPSDQNLKIQASLPLIQA